MQQRRHRVYDIEELCTLKDDGRRWLVKNMIPRIGRTMVWGEGGAYKTSLLFDLCVAVASGGSLLRQFPVEEHGPVFIVSAEGSKYTNRDRILDHLRARESDSPELYARGDRPPIPSVADCPLYYCQQAYVLDDMQDAKEFREDVERIKPILILLDPLDSFLEGDENSAKETKNFRRFLDTIVSEFECALLIIHHSTKGEKPSLRGSTAWRGWVDASIQFNRRSVKIEQDTVNFVEVISQKQRDGEEGHIFSVLPEFNKARRTTTYSIVDTELNHDLLMRSTVQQRVLEVLQLYGPLTQKDVIALTKFSWKRVSTALEMLAVDGLVAQDTDVTRPTSADGSRVRTVPAWRALVKTSLVDVATALLKERRRTKEEEEDRYNISAFGPPPQKALEDGHSGQPGATDSDSVPPRY